MTKLSITSISSWTRWPIQLANETLSINAARLCRIVAAATLGGSDSAVEVSLMAASVQVAKNSKFSQDGGDWKAVTSGRVFSQIIWSCSNAWRRSGMLGCCEGKG